MKIQKRNGSRFDPVMLSVIFSLAWPTMLEQLMQTAVQYIDTAMVGSLGTMATAAVGSTSTVNWMIISTVSAIGVGFLAFISQSFGAGDHSEARKASAQAVTMTAVVGCAFSAITICLSSKVPVWMRVDEDIQGMAARYFLILYIPMLFRTSSIIIGTVLRSVGDTRTPMQVGITVNIINILLNFLLIYPSRNLNIWNHTFPIWGAGQGIEGAAWASAVSYTYGGMAITAALWKHKDISPKGERFLPDWRILRQVFRVAFPNMVQRFATSLGYVVFASLINALGGIATAAHTIANTVESAFYIPGWGMQTAAAALAGNALGAKDEKKLNSLAANILPMEIFLMVISGGLLFLTAPQLICLFTKDEEVIRLGVTVLRMVAISEPFYGVPIVIEGMMQGVGKTREPMIYNIFGMWFARIAGTFICTHYFGMGLVSAWACMIIHNLILFACFTVMYVSNKWKPEIMKENS